MELQFDRNIQIENIPAMILHHPVRRMIYIEKLNKEYYLADMNQVEVMEFINVG